MPTKIFTSLIYLPVSVNADELARARALQTYMRQVTLDGISQGDSVAGIDLPAGTTADGAFPTADSAAINQSLRGMAYAFMRALATPPTVTPFAYLNSWTDYGTGYVGGGYWRDVLGKVWLRGLVKRTVAGFGSGVPITQLPPGYRPSAGVQIFAVVGNDKWARVDIDTAGNVFVLLGDSATPEHHVSLDGISFDTF